MKIIFMLLGMALLVVLGLVWFIQLGVSTVKYPIAEYAEGNDRLTLEYRHTTDWGNSLTATILYFNGKMVDFRGTLREYPNEGNKVFPVRSADKQQLSPSVVDEKNAPVLSAIARMQRGATYFFKSDEFLAIEAQHPDLSKRRPWTIWVNPNDFSRAEYQRIMDMLRNGGAQLIAQQQNAETHLGEDDIKRYGWDGEHPLAIWRTVYFDYNQLKSEIFERKTAQKEEIIEISPGGAANFRHKIDKYVAGYGCSLGLLNDTGDTLVVNRAWQFSDETFPISELSAFRDVSGRSLTEVYSIVEEPE